MKRSNTPGAKPVSLGYAEVAINTADGIFPFGQVDLMSNGVNGWTLMGTPATTTTATTTDDGSF